MKAEIKDINKLYILVLKNRKKGIKIRETLKGQNYSSGNFYRRISKKQALSLSQLKGLSKHQKKEFEKLYLKEGWTADRLRKRYGCRTDTAVNFVKEITDDNVRSLKSYNRKLTKYQVIKILITYMKYGRGGRWGNGEITQKELGLQYGVCENVIHSICTGRHWKHIFQKVKKKYNKEILGIIDKHSL